MAKQYRGLRLARSSTVVHVANQIIDKIAKEGLPFSAERESVEAITASQTTTFLYANGASFPALFEFLAEALHSAIPIQIGSCKFGPNEVLVHATSKRKAIGELDKSIDDLRRLLTAKRSEILARLNAD
jgi:hypothetical protein